jgi:hypothetical protein
LEGELLPRRSTPQRQQRRLSKIIGEGVLFANVRISRATGLRAIRARLYQTAYIDGPAVGHLIHDLELADLLEEDGSDPVVNDVTEMVLSVLMLCPCLQRYTMHGWTTNQSEFICLSRSAGTWITYLDISIRPDIDGVFPIINSFQNLQSLLLWLGDEPWQHSILHPIQNQGIRHMGWVSLAGDKPMLSFLSQCLFGPGCTLSIDLPGCEASVLNPIFSRNLFCELVLSIPTDSMASLSPDILRIPKLTFAHCPPPAHLFDHPYLPRELVIDDVVNYTEDDDFWEMMSALAGSQCRYETPTVLRICEDQDVIIDQFGQDEPSEFMSRLLPLAITLYGRGIVIVDKYGQDISSFIVNES